MNVQIWVMGTPSLTDPDGAPVRMVSRRAWALLTYLVSARGVAVRRIDLAELLWPTSGEEQARASLRQELAVTRKNLRAAGIDVVEAGKDTVRFIGPETLADCLAVEDLVAAGGLAELRAAAELCRGPLLEGLTLRSDPFMDWLEAERAALKETAADAFAALLRAEEQDGDPEAVMAAANAWLAADPAAEPAHRAAMRVLAEAGRTADALRQYDRCVAERRRMQQAPEEETAALARSIREDRTRQDSPLSADAAGAPAVPTETRPSAVERGIGTVLVAQMPELAALAPDHDPAALFEAQAWFNDAAATGIAEAGGWLLPGPGDRAVAVFADGTEVAATRAALQLAAARVPVGGARLAAPACGLARGELMLSEGGGLAGVPLPAAARAAGMARPGEVVAAKGMVAELQAAFEFAGGPARDLMTVRAVRAGDPIRTSRPEMQRELVQLWQAWAQAVTRADLRTALSHGREAAALKGEGRAVGEAMLGAAMLLRGEIAAAGAPLEAAAGLAVDPEPLGLDPGLTARALLAWQRCLAGAPGQGGEDMRRVLSEAGAAAHAPTALLCHLVAVMVLDELGETRAALRCAHAACQAAEGRPRLLALAGACLGRCRDRIGEPAGAEQLDDALTRYRGAGGVAAVPLIQGWCAASRLETGAPAEGLALVEEALAGAAATGMQLPRPELLRLKAALLARLGQAGSEEVEAAFAAAVGAAQAMGAGLYQLRASVGFAAHLRGVGRLREAVQRLDQGIAALTPGGPPAADLKSAQALKHRLALG